MNIITTQKLLDNLIAMEGMGLQISRRHGILNSTKCIYYKNELIFLFNISDNFRFLKSNGMSTTFFLEQYKDQQWIIEEVIS